MTAQKAGAEHRCCQTRRFERQRLGGSGRGSCEGILAYEQPSMRHLPRKREIPGEGEPMTLGLLIL